MRARDYAGLLTACAITMIAPPSYAQRAGDGFLFHVPIGTWGVRGGINLASANSDVFAFVTDQLTRDRSDFNAPAVGTNIAIRLAGANDIVLDVGYSTVSRGSEFRHWVDQNDQPIEQTTSLRRIPITLGLRHYVTSRGRSVGQFAWIPRDGRSTWASAPGSWSTSSTRSGTSSTSRRSTCSTTSLHRRTGRRSCRPTPASTSHLAISSS